MGAEARHRLLGLLLAGCAAGTEALRLKAGSSGRCGELSRRAACRVAAATFLISTPLAPAFAADKGEAAAANELKEVSSSLKSILDQKDAFIQGLVNSDPAAPTLPQAVGFSTFQKLEKTAGPAFMEAAIDYAEASRNARDLVKLAKLTKQTVEVTSKEKGKPRTTELKSYSEVRFLACMK